MKNSSSIISILTILVLGLACGNVKDTSYNYNQSSNSIRTLVATPTATAIPKTTATPKPKTNKTIPPLSNSTVGTPQRTPYPTPAQRSVPSGASARCRDGTLSYSRNRRGTCSHHGGVAEWF